VDFGRFLNLLSTREVYVKTAFVKVAERHAETKEEQRVTISSQALPNEDFSRLTTFFAFV